MLGIVPAKASCQKCSTDMDFQAAVCTDEHISSTVIFYIRWKKRIAEKHSDWPVEENENDGQTISGKEWCVLKQAGWRGNDTRLHFFKVLFFSTLGLFVGGFHIITLSHINYRDV